jgi:hypothetical protein
MNALAPIDLGKLARIAGLFGSTHIGERAAAAAKADAIVRAAGLTWPDVLTQSVVGGGYSQTSRRHEAPMTPGMILARHGDKLTGWERGFLTSLLKSPSHRWSAKQNDALAGIRARFAGRAP